MKTPKQLLIVLIAGSVFFSCSKDDGTSGNVPANSVKSKLKSAGIIKSSNTFGLKLLKEVNMMNSDSNIFISPFSALQALSMTYNGTNGITKDEMTSALAFNGYSDDEINNYNQSLTNALVTADEKVKMEVANSIWYDSYFTVLQPFVEINTNYYDAEVNKVPFADSQTLDLINGWCNTKTHEKIPKIIDKIPGGAVMYLINAIYFLGTWQYEFDSTKTTEVDFKKEDMVSVKHRQMITEENFNYIATDAYKAVELPYGNGAFNLLLILPKSGTSISAFIELLDNEKWSVIIGGMEKTKVVVKIPKFKLECNGLLNEPLKNMGMISAFDNADFSRLSTEDGLCISRVIHKTFIDLNEKGTEAAAVTAVEIIKTTANGEGEDVKWFVANRPFIYAITEKSTGAIIFIGTMMDPAQTKVKY